MTVFDWTIEPVHREAKIWKAEVVADVEVINKIEDIVMEIYEQEN